MILPDWIPARTAMFAADITIILVMPTLQNHQRIENSIGSRYQPHFSE